MLGSRGIELTAVVGVDAGELLREGRLTLVRDSARALVWVVLGWDLTLLSALVHPARYRAAREWRLEQAARGDAMSLHLALQHAMHREQPARQATEETQADETHQATEDAHQATEGLPPRQAAEDAHQVTST